VVVSSTGTVGIIANALECKNVQICRSGKLGGQKYKLITVSHSKQEGMNNGI